MEDVLKKLEDAIAAYKKEAETFYSKGNKEAAKRARKALKEIKEIAYVEWKNIQDVKNTG